MGLFDFLKKKEFALIKELNAKLERYKSIIDIEEETNKRKNELNEIISSKTEEIKTIDNEKVKLNSDYITSLDLYTKLRKEINLYESKLDLIEFGIYEPVYEFEKSDDYRIEQSKIIEKQKDFFYF